MTAPPAGPRAAALPCRAEPDRWFDPRDRSHALAGCLACPARRWCAGQALRGASWGMWAGIWIEDDLAAVAHYLRAIAQLPPAAGRAAAAQLPAAGRAVPAAPPAAGRGVSAWPATTAPQRPADRGGEPPRIAHSPTIAAPRPRRSAAAAVLARSSGHCEVMAPGCRLGFDVAVRRTPGACADGDDASALYAACTSCRGCVSGLDDRVAARLGYVVDAGRPAAAVAFYWRQTHWMLLQPAGGLHDTGAAA